MYYCLILWIKEENWNCENILPGPTDPQIHRDLRTTVGLVSHNPYHGVYPPAAVTENKTYHHILRSSLASPFQLAQF